MRLSNRHPIIIEVQDKRLPAVKGALKQTKVCARLAGAFGQKSGEGMMNQISITWGHFPDTEIFTVTARGLTHAQLRHYAQQVGYLDFQDDDSEPVLLGATHGQKEALLCILEGAGYEIERIENVGAFSIGNYP